MGNEEGIPNIVLAVETLETFLSLWRRQSDTTSDTTARSGILTQVDGTRNGRTIRDSPRTLPINQNGACKSTTHDSTDLVVATCTVVSPCPCAKHAFCEFLQILDHPPEL
jgi:hypothetical protein